MHLVDALPLLDRAQPAEIESLAYQVTMASASANCRNQAEEASSSQGETDLVVRRIYARLSCSPLSPRVSHSAWIKAAPRRRSPPARVAALPAPEIEAAITRGAAIVGVSPAYLRSTAIAESGLRPAIRAATSSATGLYQFLDNTWLASVRRYGPDLGLTLAANAVETDSSGRAQVRDPQAKAAILALRSDPLISTAVAGMLTRDNASRLAASGVDTVTADSLYAAHVLGAHGAAMLYRQLSRNPQISASGVFTAAAGPNHGLFFAGGRPRSLLELQRALRRKIGG